MRISSHLVGCIDFLFYARISRYNTMNLRNITVLWCRETCIVGTRALFCMKYGSRNFGIMQIIFFVRTQHLTIILLFFYTKLLQYYTVYCFNCGLSHAPCDNYQFLFVSRQICLVQQQTMSNVFNKKICGGLLSCKPWYCSIGHLEALEFIWLCGNKAFSETLRCFVFCWTAPCLIIVEWQVVGNVWAMHATVEFWWEWLHIQKDAQDRDASAGVSLDEIQQEVFL